MKRLNPASLLAWGLGVALILTGGAAAQTPLSLAAALAEARKNSDETRLIGEKSAKLEAMKRELYAGALPNISAYANAGRGSMPSDPAAFGIDLPDSLAGVINPVLNRYSYGVQATQPIYSFGRLGQAFRTANKQIKSQDAANRRSMQELELRTLDAFYAAVLAEAKLKVIAASIERQGRTAGFLEANFRRGAGSRSTMLLTAAALKSLEPERIRAARDADAARMSLNRLLGRPVDGPLILDTVSVFEEAGPVLVNDGGMETILDNRPDIEAIRYQKETTRGIATTYRMQYLPALGAQAKVGILAYQLDEQMTDFDKNLEWQVGVGLTWPLFDGFAMSSKARQYDSDARSLAIGERQARAYARIEIESARREADAADTALSAARQARDASAEAADMIGRDFRAGAGQITDLLSAEEGLRNAEVGLLAARYQKARAGAALRVALGMDLIKETSK